MLSKSNRMNIVNRVYRHKIEIWDLESTEENIAGEEVQVPKRIDSIWADVLPIRGKEYFEAQRIVPELQYKVVTRYRDHIHPSMLIKWGERTLNINSIIDISGRQEHIEIMCTEKVE